MLPRVIFCVAVCLAILAVILLTVLSPVSHRKPSKESRPWLALSLYLQQPRIGSSNKRPVVQSAAGAFIFHRTLTEGPKNTSRAVGKAQGFIIPVERFARSPFNIIHLTFNTPEYAGSLIVQAKRVGHEDTEDLTVVGGTGSFAFARGLAVFAQTDRQPTDVDATYQLKLELSFPNQSRTIPG